MKNKPRIISQEPLIVSKFKQNMLQLKNNREGQIRKKTIIVDYQKQFQPFKQLTHEAIQLIDNMYNHIMDELKQINKSTPQMIENKVNKFIRNQRFQYFIKNLDWKSDRWSNKSYLVVKKHFYQRANEEKIRTLLVREVSDKIQNFNRQFQNIFCVQISKLMNIKQELMTLPNTDPHYFTKLNSIIMEAKNLVNVNSQALQKYLYKNPDVHCINILKGKYQIMTDEQYQKEKYQMESKEREKERAKEKERQRERQRQRQMQKEKQRYLYQERQRQKQREKQRNREREERDRDRERGRDREERGFWNIR